FQSSYQAFEDHPWRRLIIEVSVVFFHNLAATTEIYTLSLHDALPIYIKFNLTIPLQQLNGLETLVIIMVANKYAFLIMTSVSSPDRKSGSAGMPRPISYAVFCLKKKTRNRCTASQIISLRLCGDLAVA